MLNQHVLCISLLQLGCITQDLTCHESDVELRAGPVARPNPQEHLNICSLRLTAFRAKGLSSSYASTRSTGIVSNMMSEDAPPQNKIGKVQYDRTLSLDRFVGRQPDGSRVSYIDSAVA